MRATISILVRPGSRTDVIPAARIRGSPRSAAPAAEVPAGCRAARGAADGRPWPGPPGRPGPQRDRRGTGRRGRSPRHRVRHQVEEVLTAGDVAVEEPGRCPAPWPPGAWTPPTGRHGPPARRRPRSGPRGCVRAGAAGTAFSPRPDRHRFLSHSPTCPRRSAGASPTLNCERRSQLNVGRSFGRYVCPWPRNTCGAPSAGRRTAGAAGLRCADRRGRR